jgi:hypothetical protein
MKSSDLAVLKSVITQPRKATDFLAAGRGFKVSSCGFLFYGVFGAEGLQHSVNVRLKCCAL